MRAGLELTKRSRRRDGRSKRSLNVASRLRLLGFEPLEDRTMLAIAVSIPPANAAPTWTDLGPSPIQNGQVTGMPLQNNPVAGAVVAFATAPSSAAPNAPTVAFAATANGGVWETNNLGATTPVDLDQVAQNDAPPGPNVTGVMAGPALGPGAGTVTAQYRITDVGPGGVESNASATITAQANLYGEVEISNIPAPSSLDTISRNIYRAVPDPSSPSGVTYWLAGTIGAAATSYEDDTTVNITTNSPGFVATNRVVQEPSPQWQAMTDQFPSLSMQSIVIDPNDPYRAFGGTGQVSASYQGATAQGIIMMTVDPNNPANNTASLLGAATFNGIDISAIEVLPGNRLLVASDDADQGGIFLSTDFTQPNVTFTRVNNNLPKGAVTDLAYIPASATNGTQNLILAAVANGKSTAGIYLNTASGLAGTPSSNWTLTTRAVPIQTGANYNFASAVVIHLSVWTGAALNTVYADTVENVTASATQEAGTAIAQVFRIDNVASPLTTNWSVVSGPGNVSVPASISGGLDPGGQGNLNSPIIADPTNRDIFYVAGDRQPIGGVGRVLRAVITAGVANVTDVTGYGAPGTGPPTGPALAASNAVGSMLTGGTAYTYVFTIVDADGNQSVQSPETLITPPPTDNQVTITLPALDPSLTTGARGWRIYREVGGLFVFVGTAPIGTPTFTDTFSDAQLNGRPFSITKYSPSSSPFFAAVGQTAPHADARAMAFLPGPNGALLESNDGGLFELNSPIGVVSLPSWESLVGNLGDVETYSTAYDPLGNVATGGNQDNGSIAETGPGATTWTLVQKGDGSAQAVAVVNPNSLGLAAPQAVYRFAVGNNFSSISRFTDNGAGIASGGTQIKLAAAATPATNLSGLDPLDQNVKGFVSIQLAVNAVNGQLLLGYNGIYTTIGFGDLVNQTLKPAGSPANGLNVNGVATNSNARVTALAYGGMNPNGSPAPNVIYAARLTIIYVRTSTNATNIFDYSAKVSTPIKSIVLDPNNWQVAFAVGAASVGGAGAVYATINGGRTWTNITGQLAPFNGGLDAVEIMKLPPSGTFPNGRDALLVGGAAGVFVAYNPLGNPNGTNTYQAIPAASPGLTWTALNVGLPHALVTQISYTPSMMLAVSGVANRARGDVLLVATLGRGVYEIDQASGKLGNTNVLTVAGPDPGASVVIQPDAQNSQVIDVIVTASNRTVTTYRYPSQLISGINVSNLGAGSTLTVSPTLSLLSPGITFDGGGNANLAFLPSQSAQTQTNTLTGTTRRIVISGPNGPLTVIYTNGAGMPASLPTYSNPVRAVGQFFSKLVSSPLGDTLNQQELPLLGALGDAVDGVASTAANTDLVSGGGDPDAGGSDSGPGLFERILEEGTGAFDVTQIGGPTIPDFPTLQQDLLDLSDPSDPGSVTYTVDPTTGYVIFNVTINKTLDGTATLDLQALGGSLTLVGTVDVSMLVHLHLVFGDDSQGFYLDTAGAVNAEGQPLPILTVDHIQLDPDPNLEATGDFGLFDITATNLALSVAPGIGLAVTLPLESLDTVSGVTDNRLRVGDFATMDELATTTLVSAPGQAITASATINVDSGLLGSLIPSSLQNLNLTFAFNDASKPNDVTISGPGFTSIGDLLQQSEAQILSGLEQLVALGNQIDASPAMALKLPVIDRSLGSYVQLGQLFNNNLYQPVNTYFASLGTDQLPTVGGLLAAITGGTSSGGDLTLSLAPGLDLSVENGAMLLSYAFTAVRNDPIALDVGLGGTSPLTLESNLAIDLQTRFSFDASIGVDLGDLLAGDTADAFFVHLNTPPTITASFLDNGQGLTLNANIGALQVGGQVLGLPNLDGTRQPLLQASVSLGLAHDSSGRTTLKTLLNTPVSQLIIPSATGSLGLDIPITASLQTSRGTYDFTAGGQPELTIVNSDLFSGTPPTITETNFSTLLSLQNLSAASLLLALDQFSSYLGSFTNSAVFTTPIPFTQGTTLGSLVNLGAAYANQLIGLTAAQGDPAFDSLQNLEQVDQATGTNPISFNFVPNFQTSTGATVPALELTFHFNQSFGGSTTGVIRGNNLNPVIDGSTPLADLNGGQGVRFSTTGGPDLSIALSDGTVFSVTFNNPQTVGDVIGQINDAPGNGGKLLASINPDQDGLLLTDLTLGKSLFNVIGQQGSGAANGLGLVGVGFGNPTLSPTTPVSHLNSGKGVSFSTTGMPDLMVTLSDGTVIPITFSDPETIADLIAQVAAAPGNDGKLSLGFNATGDGLALFDASGGPGTLSVQAAAGSQAAVGLGLVGSGTAGPTITTGTLLSQLYGGQGVAFSTTGAPDLTVNFADGTSLDITLTDPVTVGDLIAQINAASGNNGAITASINAAGNGLVLAGSQPFSVVTEDGTTAADLGLGVASTGNTLNGRNINPAVLNGQGLNALQLALDGQALDRIPDLTTPLSDLNLGAGVSFQGESGNDLQIQAGDGTIIDVSLGTAETVGDVINAINRASTKVVASLGKMGLILTDTTVGTTVPFSVESLGGSTVADDLGIDEAPITAPINFNFNLGGLASLSTNSQVFLQANVDAGFTLGILLRPLGQGTALTADTALSTLQNGQGIQFATGGQADLQVTLHDGTTLAVALGGSTTIGAVLARLNAAAPGKLTAAIGADGLGLTLTDATTGTSAFTVTAINGSSAAAQLGILGTGDINGMIEGTALSGVSLADNIVIQNASMGGSITIGGTLNATASFGFLGVNVRNGTVTASANASFTLGNLDGPASNGYSTLNDLTDALGNIALSVVAANPGPADGHTGISYGTSTFQVQIGQGTTYTVTIQDSAVPAPASLSDLIANLNASLKTARDPGGNTVDLSGQVRALDSGGNVAFTLSGGIAQTLTILNAGALGFNAVQSNYVARPSVILTADVKLPIVLGSTFSGLNPADFGTGIQVEIPSPGIAFDLDYGTLLETPFAQYTTVNLGQLQYFSGFNFQTFVNALDVGLKFLTDTADAATNAGTPGLAFLNQQLPLVNVSLRDILGYTSSFTSFVAQLANDPSDNLQDLASTITSLLGLPAGAIDLGLDTSVTGTILAPATGVLAGAAHFQLVLDGGAPVGVTVPNDASNTTVAGLVNDINTAFNTAGLGAKVVAETSGGYITLQATGAAPASMILVQGIPTGDPAASVLGLANGQTSSEALRLDLKYAIASYSNTFTPSLSIPGLTTSLSLQGSTTATLSASATFQLALGIGLSGAGAFQPFLYDYNTATQSGTGLTLGAYAAATSITAGATLGPLGVSVQNGYAAINDSGTSTSTKPAQIVLGLRSPASGTPPSGLAGRHTLTDPILADLGVVTAAAHAGADLPIYYAIGNSAPEEIYDLRLADDLTNPISSFTYSNGLGTGTLSEAISNALSNVSITQALSGISAGFDALFGPLFTGVDGQVLGSNLPLIGPGIASAATFLSNLKSGFDAALTATTSTITKIEMAIYSEFGPSPGLGWLQPIPNNTLSGYAHYIVAQSFVTGPQGAGAQFYVHLAQDAAPIAVPLSANLGLPGLGLNVSGSAYVSLDWDLQLGFGLNTTEGFYINSSQGTPYPTSLSVSADVTLANPTTHQPLSATGTLGYLQIKATDDTQKPTDFHGAFAITLTDPGAGGPPDGHLTFGKFASAGFSSVVGAGFNADAAVNLDLSSNFVDASGNPISALPQLRTLFQLDWPFSATTTAGIATATPTISFNQVQINLGTFLSNFAGPVLGDVKAILAPVQPVINALTQPIPVISNLAGHDVSLIDLAQTFGQNGTANFLNALVAVNNLVNSIAAANLGPNVWIDLGSFTVSGAAAKNPAKANALTPATLSPDALAQINSEISSRGGTGASNFMNGVSRLSSIQGGGISFPILSNPLDAFQLLLGNDGASPPSLFQLTLPTLTLGLKYTQTFRIPALPILAVQLSGQVGATLSFAFGFDTKGLSEYRASTSKNIAQILDGFYVVDDPGVNQVVLTAGIAATAAVDAYFVSAGVTGGVYANVRFHLHNDSDDPRLRFSAIASQLVTNPLGIFDVSGDLTARLFAFVEIYYVFSSSRYEYNLASATLLSFNTNPQAGQARDVTSVGSSAATAVYGQPVTLTANVRPTSAASNAPVPAGSVQFYDTTTNTNLGTVPVSPSGVATLNVSNLVPGNHAIRASYTSTNNYRASQDTLTQVVSAASTTTTVAAGPPNPVYGQSLTFTATVNAASPGSGTPAGTVQFYLDGSTVGAPVATSTVNGVSTAVLSVTAPVASGAHAITATFTSGNTTRFGGSSTSGSIGLTVRPAPSQTAAAAGTPGQVAYGQAVSFVVSPTSSGAGTPTGSVDFIASNSGSDLGTVPLVNGVATIPYAALVPGSYAIVATYLGDPNFQSSVNAQPFSLTVSAASTTTAVSVSASPVVEGNPVTFTAVVSDASPGGLTPTGEVQFEADGQNVGDPQPLDASGTATFTTSTLAIGLHGVVAVYQDPAGDFAGSLGTLANSLSIIPKIATSITVATSSANPSEFGATIALTAAIHFQNLIATSPSGPVEFFDTTTDTDLGTAVPANGTATLTFTSSLEPGAHAIVASFAGDSELRGEHERHGLDPDRPRPDRGHLGQRRVELE